MTRASFLANLATAKPGDKIVYHTGLLMMDRMFGPTFQNVHAIGTAALEAWDENRVHLVQKRIAPGVCAYIAIKRGDSVHLRADQKTKNRYVEQRKSRVTAAVREA